MQKAIATLLILIFSSAGPVLLLPVNQVMDTDGQATVIGWGVRVTS